ncbi:VacJ family lipoprotein [Vibrio plantisponsor]|uniref:VacJ family lipoprotein n=1 Tax=Vibrio plantisponsor TaxID=664643 RepID=A0ABU4IGK3_9VIBR|nr:VacJ family lipoprotein [Vibrio plantisponsor]MDW6017682.1 VacJ family lipoprotein [Vibrio plantisponsor]NNM40515.1 VacJ family lipoprotein [Vibrio plantisponsor]
MISRLTRIVLLSLMVVITGCSSVPDDQSTSDPQVNDPFEGFNRTMWAFNYDYLDPYFVRPVSLAYVEYTPDPVRHGIANFLSNLDEPSSMINNLLMGNGKKALDHFNRFWINSTFGLLGLIDIASEAGITKHGEKAFSDAMGHNGVGKGPYVMVPGYGPVVVREAGDVVDGLYAPLSYLNIWASVGKWALEGMETRAALVSQEALLENSPDSYSFTRAAYLQRRDFTAEVETPTEVDNSEEDYFDSYMEEGF